MPKLFNLRTDPFERADITSNTYYDWLLDHVFLVLAAQALVAQFLATFEEFPPRQKAASFTIDQVIEKLEAALARLAETVLRDGATLSQLSMALDSGGDVPAWAPTSTTPRRRRSTASRVDGFWIDRYRVTNAEFAAFVEATGYVTVAERPLDPADFPGAPPENLVPGSLVFTHDPRPGRPAPPEPVVDVDAGRELAPPGGPGHRDRGPGAIIRWSTSRCEDAAAYAPGPGKALPTEAEWERAARGGLDGAEYVWGDEPESPGGELLANYWHGRVPVAPRRASDGLRPAPVGSFPPNGYGLFDMAGNAWEWTSDWYGRPTAWRRRQAVLRAGRSAGREHRGSYDPAPASIPGARAVIKGGSFLCADSYCRRYRPAARRPQMIDTGMSHIGFRCVVRAPRRAGTDTGLEAHE